MLAPNEHFLFVYGTLKQGYPNSDYLAHADFIGDFEVNGCKMAELPYAPALVCYPSLSNEARAAKVKGELYCVSAAHLRNIDKLEGHPHFYERQQLCWINLVPGRHVCVFAYIYKHSIDKLPLITEWTKKPLARELLSYGSVPS